MTVRTKGMRRFTFLSAVAFACVAPLCAQVARPRAVVTGPGSARPGHYGPHCGGRVHTNVHQGPDSLHRPWAGSGTYEKNLGSKSRDAERSAEIRARAAEQEREILRRRAEQAQVHDAILNALPTCAATEPGGRPCRAKANPGEHFCAHHLRR